MDRKTLCLWIPHFRTTVEAQTQPSWSGQPLAIYAQQANQRRLIEVSEAAQHAGLRLGMAVKEAAQRCPEGVYVPDDPARYGKAFEAVLDVLDRFSPVVEDAGVGLAFADGAGLEPLYGPDAELGARLRRDVEAATGQVAHVGLARGRLAAEVAARTAGDSGVAVVSGDDRAYLAEQPVDRLPLDERAVGHLRMLGIGTISAFAELPANAVRTRYGVEGARARGLAQGEDPQPLKGRPRPIVLDEAIDFEWEEHNVDRLTFALQALAQRLAARLARRGLMAQQVGSRIERADGTVQRFSLDLPEASGSAATLRDAARWRLEAWAEDVQRGFCVTRGVGARKTPHRFPPGTAEPRIESGAGSASPPGGDLCVTRGWVPGRPLTGFGRRRPNLPLPLERVKIRRIFEDEASSAKVSGEGKDRRPLEQIDTEHRCFPRGGGESGRSLADERGYAEVSQGEAAVQEIPLQRPGVVRIGLEVQQLVPGAGTQRSLLGNRSERVARANQAIGRLRAQLGDEAVFRMELCPEAWTLERAARRVDAYVETDAQGDLCITREWLPGRLSSQPSPTGDLGVTRGRVPGRPLTDFRRRRRNPGSSPGQAEAGSNPLPERPLRNPELVARKTPHRFPPRTAESASPPGEGEEPPRLRGRGALFKGLTGRGSKSGRSSADEGRDAEVSDGAAASDGGRLPRQIAGGRYGERARRAGNHYDGRGSGQQFQGLG
ncbi:MAG: DNA polymerase Y family protein, partial [Chloroflexi bacterium]|nr:DNA polymerase Y family protein [Chloroflexota bacterium]